VAAAPASSALPRPAGRIVALIAVTADAALFRAMAVGSALQYDRARRLDDDVHIDYARRVGRSIPVRELARKRSAEGAR
jgi:hypothetical protein